MHKLIVWSRNHPKVIILLTLLISAVCAPFAIKLDIDTSTEKMMIKGDPNLAYYKKTTETFGTDNIITVYIRDKNLWTIKNLEKLEEVFFELQDIPYVIKANSIFNVKNFKGSSGMLSTDNLMNGPPLDENELQSIKNDAINNPLIKGDLITEDARAIMFSLQIERDSKHKDFDAHIYNKVDNIIAPLKKDFSEVFQVGQATTNKSIKDSILRDQKTLIPLSVFVVLLLLVIGLRTFSSAFLPAVTGGLSVFWTFGFMEMMGVPIQMLTVIVPSMILVLGATEDMHIISEYFEGLEEGKDPMGAVEYMGKKVATAVSLTAFTTFFGFLTIIMNDMTMLKEFGIAASFGLFINYFVTMCICPVFLRLFGKKTSPFAGKDNTGGVVFKKAADFCDHLVHNYKKHFLILGTLFIAFMIYSAQFVKVDNDLLGSFKESSTLRKRVTRVQDIFGGTQMFYIVLESKDQDAFKKIHNLKILETIENQVKKLSNVDKAKSLATHLSLTHREMNAGKAKYFKVPEKEDLISQYLLFFTRDDIERYISPNFKKANIVVGHGINSSYELSRLTDKVAKIIDKSLINTQLTSKITSEGILINDAANSIAVGQVKSLSLLLGVILLIMSLLFVNIKAGLLSLIPNAVPIIILFGVMGLFGVPLNTGTAMIAVIAIGIAIDDTIHFMVRYNAEMKRLNDPKLAIKETLRNEMRPVLTTSFALALGFGVLGLSEFIPLIYFGLLSSMVMLLALFSDMFITPMLLSSIKISTILDFIQLKFDFKELQKSPLFQDMTKFQVKKVILMSYLKNYSKGETIIKQGDLGNELYFILNGEAKVTFNTSNGDERTVSHFKNGDIFGEVALVKDIKRTANVIALSDLELCIIDWKSLERFNKIHPFIAPKLYLNISRILGQRLATTTNESMSA